MLQQILDFLSAGEPPRTPPDRKLAVAVLLVEAAHRDDTFSSDERAVIGRLLADKFGLTPQERDRLQKAVTQGRLDIKQDRKEITRDRRDLKHDTKALDHAKDRVKADRKKGLKDLRPAEYKMGLQATNKARTELGLKKVDHVIRPLLGTVTATQRRLASDAVSTAMGMGGYVSGGLCATGVSRTIARAMGITVTGNGNQIDNNLPRSKFRQVHIPLAKALKIPGLVLTWEHTSTALGSIYGHTAITLGDGHSSASDFIERDTLAGNRSRTGLKIFVPIA